jgi:diadenosine tetraphosphate (Ap4A) HIT family hydrolase
MADDTHEDICTFCCEVRGSRESNLFYDLGLAKDRKDYLLRETEHFVIMPCIGALTDWYVLIVSRRHALSVGWLDQPERDELRIVLDETQTWLRKTSGQEVVFFEHGSYDFRDKGGACYDHAHIHAVATARGPQGFLNEIPPGVTFQSSIDWIADAHQMVSKEKSSYLSLIGGDMEMIAPATGAPSQFFRRCLAAWLGAEQGEWDWLAYPQTERVKEMMSLDQRPVQSDDLNLPKSSLVSRRGHKG